MISTNHKHNKVWFLLLIIVIFATALVAFSLITPGFKHSSNVNQIPDAMQELAENNETEWMAGMWVELTNGTLEQSNTMTKIESYSVAEDVIQASIMLQNGLNMVQPYNLMVLADGVPVEFLIENRHYFSYPIALSEKGTKLKIELHPYFSQNLGRLDFLLFFDGNPESDYHMNTYTVHIMQPENAKATLYFHKTTTQREGVVESFSNGAYGAWLWNEDTLPIATDHIGPREITIMERETLLLEAIASTPGLYRTVLVMNGQPISVLVEGTVESYLDWESDSTNMLQVPIELSKDTTIAGSFFTVTTPMEAEKLVVSSIASGKILVNSPRTEKE